MILFKDGPAAGKVLTLRRAPLFLRAVRSRSGMWDALDQLDDEPRPGETVHVYRRAGKVKQVHVLRSPRRLSGWVVMADYLHLAEQPLAGVTRDLEAWQNWCLAEQARERAGVTT